MRQRSPRCVVSFHTTAGAMAAERLCRREGLEGGLREAGIEAAGFHDLLL